MGGLAAAAAEGFTDDIVRTPHTNGQTIDVPARRRYAMAAGQAGGRTGARVRSAQQRRFETDDYGMEERSTPLVGVRPQIFVLFLFVSERYFHLYTTSNTYPVWFTLRDAFADVDEHHAKTFHQMMMMMMMAVAAATVFFNYIR